MTSTSCQSSSSISFTSLRISESEWRRLSGSTSSVSSSIRLEEEGHGRAEGVALGNELPPVEVGLLAPGQLEVDDRLLLEARQVDILRALEDLGGGLALGVAQDPVPVVQVTVQFHEADGHQAVEPGVGEGLHGLLEAVTLDALLQLLPLLGDRAGVLPACDHSHVTPGDERLRSSRR